MSIKPVAWMYRGTMLGKTFISVHKEQRPDYMTGPKPCEEIPLYSAPAPELVAVLRKMVYGPGDQLPEAISEARALLARIEGEQK